MKFLFINKPFFIEPLGIMYLASSIKKQGHEVDLVLTNQDLEKKVSDFKPDFIGYSIMTGDQKMYDDINKKLKQKNNFFSIAGGPHPTFFPEMLKSTSFDAICRGEGEEAIKYFLDNPSSKNTPNFWFKGKNTIIKNPPKNLIENLNDIEFPDRGIVFKYPEIEQGPIKHFIASRGCPYNCAYCFNEAYSKIYKGKGKRVRFRSVDNLLQEVEEVIENSPTKFVYFQDDTFILNTSWVKEFSMKYKKKINTPFHCHTRANLVTEEIADNLKNAGCYSVHIAAEAGNENVRRKILNRNMTNNQIISAVDMFKKNNIKTMLQNILGLPFTTLKEDFETLELNILCQPDYAWASIFQPYPKTKLGQRCVEQGVYTGDFSNINNNFFDNSVINIPHKNEVANLQKLFAVAVNNQKLYSLKNLKKMVERPYEETKEEYSEIYKDFRKQADKILYGIEL